MRRNVCLILSLVALMIMVISIPIAVMGEEETAPLNITVIGPHEGELDPNQFKHWKPVKFFPCPNGEPHYHLILANPDPDADIKWVEAGIVPGMQWNPPIPNTVVLIGYSYYKDGVQYIFSLVKPEKKTPDTKGT